VSGTAGLALLLLLLLSGCAGAPPRAANGRGQPAEAASPPPVPPAPPAAASPAPAPTPPPEAAGPGSATPAPGAEAPAVGGPTLTASLPPAEARRLREATERAIQDSARLLRQVEGRPLGPKDRELFVLAQSLVEQAKKALGAEEYERASNLAAKAHTLAEDLTRAR
jgi:hypothetical protein